MKTSIPSCFASALLLSTALPLLAENWPEWRGPQGTGVSSEKDFPLKWSTNQTVRWRVDLPGPGNSSPIIWGQRVFVTQAVQKENRRTVLCFDRSSGKLLWQSGVTYAEPEPTQESNPYCAGTPATDGNMYSAVSARRAFMRTISTAKKRGIATWASSTTCSATPSHPSSTRISAF